MDISTMDAISNLGKYMVLAGGILIVIGLLLWSGFRLPLVGKLPGDFSFKGKNFSFYFPLATSLLASILLSLILYLIRKFF